MQEEEINSFLGHIKLMLLVLWIFWGEQAKLKLKFSNSEFLHGNSKI
jgi:hypothetical protein